MAEIVEHELTAPWEGFLAEPVGGPTTAGVVVLSGSSGRIERDRCRLFARAGVAAVSVRWFGGPGQSPGICEIPLETFAAATGLLRDRGIERVSMLGVSKGAEAALLLSTLSDRADAVIALAPTSVVWANVGPGADGRERPHRSCWTWRGQPLPFVPYEDTWKPAEPDGTPVSVLGWYERSLVAFADRLPAATIPVEKTAADLVLVAGGADRMWPSLRFARELADRYATTGRTAPLITRPDAGHRTVFPGEVAPPASTRFDHGGTPEAGALLGAAAWPTVLATVQGA
ncbi:acyl-CoA thioester hydrolase/BAAT C-terminal domain-containing protein [Actinacidiphila acidipaludis]|uniref:Acyl-CoA thioesterase n=1 Tax=Actinacidiphila acidipaludis TaxID=2873382 RepID=A0ABS7Q4A6_9ACTN|nr:acyl-CoA thioester hydrolase/BAAT C-terminal domain-containing protein [Streptomyces acidipaludis]MBY8877989.1 acyl-CoA thioesterase [Streptomyces acidipaludis]